jgi:hypothetical protein
MDAPYTSNDRPYRPWVPIVVEALLGAAVGVLAAIGGGYLGPALVNNDTEGFRALGASIVGAFAGYVLGAPLGVIGAGRLLKQSGRAWGAFAGSVLGAIALIVVGGLLRLNQFADALPITLAVIALLGAVVGYQRRRSAR